MTNYKEAKYKDHRYKDFRETGQTQDRSADKSYETADRNRGTDFSQRIYERTSREGALSCRKA